MRPVLITLALLALADAASTQQTYVQENKFVAFDGVLQQRFGMALAVDGNTAVVGAPLSKIGNRAAEGAAYVFKRTGTSWALETKLIENDGALDGSDADHFGASVAVYGDTIAVGAPQNPAPVPPQSGFVNRGAVYVFVRSGGTAWTVAQKLVATDATLGDQFGTAVALSADTLVVGAVFAPTPMPTSPESGAAYVFVGSGATWSQQGKLIPQTATTTGGATFDNFGAGVALVGDIALVGAAGTDTAGKSDRGAAYVYERSAGAWSFKAQLLAVDGAAGDRFGSSIAAATDKLIVGAPNAAINNKQTQGAGYVFARSGSTWVQEGKLVASDGVALDNLGASVAVWGGRAVAGAPSADPGVLNLGAIYVFLKQGANWSQETKLAATGGAPGEQVGHVMAGSINLLVTSGDFAKIGANTEQGAAYAFRIPNARRDRDFRDLPPPPTETLPPGGRAIIR